MDSFWQPARCGSTLLSKRIYRAPTTRKNPTSFGMRFENTSPWGLKNEFDLEAVADDSGSRHSARQKDHRRANGEGDPDASTDMHREQQSHNEAWGEGRVGQPHCKDDPRPCHESSPHRAQSRNGVAILTDNGLPLGHWERHAGASGFRRRWQRGHRGLSSSTGGSYILLSSTNYTTYGAYVSGLTGDVPVHADYDGDG